VTVFASKTAGQHDHLSLQLSEEERGMDTSREEQQQEVKDGRGTMKN